MGVFVLAGWSGFLAGAVHVVAGADHLAALLPLSVGRRRRAFRTGAAWGVGHSAGVLLVGLLALALRERLDLHLVATWGERLVGVLLVGLGLLGVRRALRLRVHAHAHTHGSAGGHEHGGRSAGAAPAHAHLHAHFASDLSDHAVLARQHGHTAFAAGTLHGVAGTAHVLGVLPALALPGLAGSLVYLGGFALGSVLAMGVFAALVGEGTGRIGNTEPRRLRALMFGAGATTAVVGAVWVWLAALPAAG